MTPTRAGIVGSPVAHSLSPVLYAAAYRTLGMPGWSFEQTLVEAGGLAAHAAALPPDWAGLAVTMPLKEEALALAREASAQARRCGAANTLTRIPGGWRADNTDVHGLAHQVRLAGAPSPRSAVVVGSGATARSAVVALHGLGVQEVRFLVRDQVRAATGEMAQDLGLTVSHRRYADPPGTWGRPDVVVSTAPPGATPPVQGWDPGPGVVVCDVVYADWPTPWAVAWEQKGVPVARGDTMLLHQGVRQFELITGREAPVAAMRAALADAVGRPA